ncbi:hypothetical protein EYS14_00075 [Alteromonadaceae bacterium M269]|nr:hypothetical protein EYS14_00075 [Alteromonadaceae bacterium M269]
MTRYYEPNPPPPLGDFTIPKGKRPNAQFRLLIEHEGELYPNVIGLAYTNFPILHPVRSDTHLGVIELVGLPDGFNGIPDMPRGYKPPLPSTVTSSNNHRCPCQH